MNFLYALFIWKDRFNHFTRRTEFLSWNCPIFDKYNIIHITNYDTSAFILKYTDKTNRNVQNRSKEEILANMLEIALSPIKKTAIMYKANLSYAQLKVYLSLLKDKGLIQELNGQWVTTEKGSEFVNAYHAILRLVKSDDSAKEVEVISKVT